MKAELRGGILDGLKVSVRQGDERVAFGVKSAGRPGGDPEMMFCRIDVEDTSKMLEMTCIYARSDRRSPEGATLFEYDAARSSLHGDLADATSCFVCIATPASA